MYARIHIYARYTTYKRIVIKCPCFVIQAVTVSRKFKTAILSRYQDYIPGARDIRDYMVLVRQISTPHPC